MAITEINEMRRSLNDKRELKLIENLNKIKTIKETIMSKTNKCIELLRVNQDLLLNDATLLEKNVAIILGTFNLDDNLANKIKKDKVSVEKNEWSEEQLNEFNSLNQMIKAIINEITKQVEDFKEDFEFILNENINIKKPVIGEIHSSLDKRVNLFSFSTPHPRFSPKLT